MEPKMQEVAQWFDEWARGEMGFSENSCGSSYMEYKMSETELIKFCQSNDPMYLKIKGNVESNGWGNHNRVSVTKHVYFDRVPKTKMELLTNSRRFLRMYRQYVERNRDMWKFIKDQKKALP